MPCWALLAVTIRSAGPQSVYFGATCLGPQKTVSPTHPQTPSLEELYVTRTSLKGSLPDTVPRGSKLRVLYGWNTDIDTGKRWTNGGFTGAFLHYKQCCVVTTRVCKCVRGAQVGSNTNIDTGKRWADGGFTGAKRGLAQIHSVHGLDGSGSTPLPPCTLYVSPQARCPSRWQMQPT